MREVEKKYLVEFVSILAGLKTNKEVEEFLSGILTPKELTEIPKRLQIIRMLKQKVPQHKIAKILGVGVATVTRGSQEIQKGKFKNVQ